MIAGGARLSDCLPTRTSEPTVHTPDRATVIGVPLDRPRDCRPQAPTIVTHLIVTNGRAGPLLLSLFYRHRQNQSAGPPNNGLLRLSDVAAVVRDRGVIGAGQVDVTA
jgi:hypothetical protein